MRNLWLRVNYDTGEVVADGLIKLQGTFFSAILCQSPLLASNRNLTIEKSVAADDTIIRLKVCKRNVWVDIRQQPNILNDPDASQFIGSIDKSDVFRLGIAAESNALSMLADEWLYIFNRRRGRMMHTTLVKES